MDDVNDRLIKSAVKRLKGSERRMYQAEVCCELCESQPRRAERRFGWCRNAVGKGLEERTIRDILQRMNYHLKQIQKSKPIKKTEETDAIFANVNAHRDPYGDDTKTLEISADTKAKVALGECSQGGKSRTDSKGNGPKDLDHDMHACEKKLTPFGILVIGTGLLSLIFGNHETSDFWGDGFYSWWLDVPMRYRKIRRLVIYMDHGPNHSGSRTQFLKRMIDFADWSGLELHLICYPPYHGKYNPIERCWSSLQQKWSGTLLTCWDVV